MKAMERGRVALTVSLPARLATEFERVAKAEIKNKSQLFREMFRVYQQRRQEEEFFELQRYGSGQARAKGILTEADVAAIVFQGR
jgi:metal-responsive CopG/Arc/MetJ family transcriptional regulator